MLERAAQPLDVGEPRSAAEARAHGARCSSAHAGLAPRDERAQERLCAEGPVAERDPVLGRERRGHEARREALDTERGGRRAFDWLLEQAQRRHLREGRERGVEGRAQLLLVIAQAGEAHVFERFARGGEADDAGHVRRARLVARGPLVPGRVAVDHARGTASAKVGLGLVEPVAAPDQGPGTERRVELVPRERDVVEALRVEVDGPMRGQLRGVDEDARAVPVGDGCEGLEGKNLPRDVARAGDREEPHAPAACLERFFGAREEPGLRPHHGQEAMPAEAAPRQEVRVVLEREAHDVGVVGQRRGEECDRVRRVPREDHLVLVARADEAADAHARRLEELARHGGGEARATVRAAVVGPQRVDRGVRLREPARGGGVVGVHGAHETPVGEGHVRIGVAERERSRARPPRRNVRRAEASGGGCGRAAAGARARAEQGSGSRPMRT
jgi:hypothetical protein